MFKLLPYLVIISFLTVLALSACSSSDRKITKAEERAYPIDRKDARRKRHGSLTGEGGIRLFGPDKGSKSSGGGGGSGIGVNSFLWRATLDTLSFMPLSSVDPYGGVIITDWYEDPDSRGTKFKINVLILGKQLRADGLRLSAFKKSLDAMGLWVDSSVSNSVSRELEDKILTRARELRVSSVLAQ